MRNVVANCINHFSSYFTHFWYLITKNLYFKIVLGPGIKIGNLFDNTEQLKRDIKNNNPGLDVETLDVVFNSNLKLGHVSIILIIMK